MTKLLVLVSSLCLISSIYAEFRVRLDGSSVRSGQRPVGAQAAVMCSVAGLDINLRPGMTWMKVGGNIASTGNVVVNKLDHFHLSMIITNGTIEDSGVYTCRASYANETKHESLDIHFFEELKFASQDQPVNAVAGADVNISCLISPMKSMQPNVFWQKGYAAITK
uniref:Ig-like domain-containing protein n=1 Tax=Plectus sambesii TaxID=2011161 RepID=A0A914WPD0_9BILA